MMTYYLFLFLVALLCFVILVVADCMFFTVVYFMYMYVDTSVKIMMVVMNYISRL